MTEPEYPYTPSDLDMSKLKDAMNVGWCSPHHTTMIGHLVLMTQIGTKIVAVNVHGELYVVMVEVGNFQTLLLRLKKKSKIKIH